ncbi:AAA family ATPase [Cystobacter fuscus]
MLLKSLTFEDKRTGWRLESLRLDRFNLLVGASGVGKTRILRAIRSVAYIGLDLPDWHTSPGARFDVHCEHAGQDYRWQFDSAARFLAPGDDEGSAAPPVGSKSVVLQESLHSNMEGLLVQRDQDRFLFKNKELPMLNRSASALQLLDEPSIVQLRRAFGSYILGALEAQGAVYAIVNPERLVRIFGSPELLIGLGGLPPVAKAFVLQEGYVDEFKKLKQLFIDIFPTIEDVAVDRQESGVLKGSQRERLSFKLKERGVPSWIDGSDISSGMVRTLNHLVDLMLAPAGTVVLIDEFENSLGVNCMGPLTDFILSRANDLQFIITSHHPYIINNIPKSYWKLVRRKGSTVRVTPASEIPALQGPSAQDDFIRLINSPEFEEGMA